MKDPVKLGGIVRSVSPVPLAEQSVEGPGPHPGGITGSAVPKRGVKRKLDAKSLETKYEVLMEVEKGHKTTDRRPLPATTEHPVYMVEKV